MPHSDATGQAGSTGAGVGGPASSSACVDEPLRRIDIQGRYKVDPKHPAAYHRLRFGMHSLKGVFVFSIQTFIVLLLFGRPAQCRVLGSTTTNEL